MTRVTPMQANFLGLIDEQPPGIVPSFPTDADGYRLDRSSSGANCELCRKTEATIPYKKKKELIAEKLTELDLLFKEIFAALNFSFDLKAGKQKQRLTDYLERGVRLYNPEIHGQDFQTYIENYLVKDRYTKATDLREFLRKQQAPLIKINMPEAKLVSLFDRAANLINTITMSNIFFLEYRLEKAKYDQSVYYDDFRKSLIDTTERSVRIFKCDRRDPFKFHTYLTSAYRRTLAKLLSQMAQERLIRSENLDKRTFNNRPSCPDLDRIIDGVPAREYIRSLSGDLDPRERAIIEKKLNGEPVVTPEYADELGVNQKRVSGLYCRARNKIKQKVKSGDQGRILYERC